MTGDPSFRIVACLDIREGRQQDFKEMAQTLAAKVEAAEPKTLDYEWYLNPDETRCYVSEWYTDSDAYLLHYEHLKHDLAQLFGIAELTAHLVFGDPDARVRKIHAGMGAEVFPGFAGFTRRK